ncbi:GT4 family glycosyltransferase PelF [Pseudonocardia hispaniensis]|uniref:GT4 family glycosyltransferase PelF n=1 Tax=Pseudonocardia hispaniensis TaxID=904933 RepID=A0ABW1J323_9PSEU
MMLTQVSEPQVHLPPTPQPRRQPRNRSLRIVLVGEGTYPYHPGGVSTWCHQLIHGMPEHRFTAVAVSVDGTERSSWPPPSNLVQVVNIPLWGPAPARRRTARNRSASFAATHETFLRALIRPPGPGVDSAPDRTDEFLWALRAMFDHAQAGDLRSALVSNEALERLLRVWWEARRYADIGPLSLRDALTATDRLEHLLRPLSHPPVVGDVCHLSMNGISALVAMAGKWAHGTPIVMSEHGVYLREQYLALDGADTPRAVNIIMLGFFRALARAAYRCADLLAPHSNYNRRWQLYNGADPARITTMYNGIDPAAFPQAQGEPELPTIVFVGRIDPLKDLHTLIRAFAIVRARVPAARLRMFGPVTPENEGYYASCLALVAQLGLSGAAVFEGRIPRQVDAYEAGHLVALTSVSEGFPYTVVESMSTGRPPVCTNVGGVSEAVGDAGFVVPPRDPAAVADACLRLLEDHELRLRLGGLARQRVLERFTLDQWTDAYRRIYDEMAPDLRWNPPAAFATNPVDRWPGADPGTGGWWSTWSPADPVIEKHVADNHPVETPPTSTRVPGPDLSWIEPPGQSGTGELTSEFWADWWRHRGLTHEWADGNRRVRT